LKLRHCPSGARDRRVAEPHHAVEIEHPVQGTRACHASIERVPRFSPFPGIRYAHDDLAAVTAPPYDVIDEDERRRLVERHPHNVVRVDLPVGGDDPYAGAAATFRQWLVDGVLQTDSPSLYLYRMTFADESRRRHGTLGVIGALGLEPPGTGDVLPHEHTTPKAKSDRLDLLRATTTNLSPVWGLSLAGGLSKLLDPSAARSLGSWRDDDGVEHELWHVTDEAALDAITESVASAPVVIADGHHRYETCLTFADERPDLPGANATLCYVVELVEEQLTVQPIHRLVGGLPADFDCLAAFDPFFDIVVLGPIDDSSADRMSEHGGLVLVHPHGTRLLRPKPHAFSGSPQLDSERLDAALATWPDHTVRFQHGVHNVVRAVERGEADAGVLLRPPTVEQIAATAHAREKMPPKSTFFWPKPRTGTVFRSLD
jgi:uncharacterized protein (DUF1015 family)